MANIIFANDISLNWTELVCKQRELLSSIPKHNRVIVRLPNTGILAATLLAGFELELVMVPLDPLLSRERFDFIAEHSEAIAEINADGLTFYNVTTATASELDDRLLIYTSGTTGDPKGVILTERNIRSNAASVAHLHSFGVSPHATCLPLWHVNALCMSLFGVYLSNGTLLQFENFESYTYFSECEKYGIQTASLVPALIRRLVEARPPWPKSLKYIITAAAPLSQQLARDFYEIYGPNLRQGYGLSEATNFSFVTPQLSDRDFVRNYVDNYPPVGIALSDTEYRIVNGEVEVRGPNVMRGYWKNSAATAESIKDGWLQTGDLGVVRDGFLLLTGRKKETLIRGGESISPVEIEEELRWNGVTGEFFAIGIESDDLGQTVGLSGKDIKADEVQQAVNKVPVKYRPIYVERNEPKATSTGKPQRTKMAAGLKSPGLSQREITEVQDLVETGAKAVRENNVALMRNKGAWSAFKQASDSIHNARFSNLPIINLESKSLPTGNIATPVCAIAFHLFDYEGDIQAIADLLSKLLPGSALIFSEEIFSSYDTPSVQAFSQLWPIGQKPLRHELIALLEAIGVARWGYMIIRHDKCELGTTFWVAK